MHTARLRTTTSFLMLLYFQFQSTLFCGQKFPLAPAMTNSDVVKLVLAGASTTAIRTQICSSEPHFDLSPKAYASLTQIGVTNMIILAMEIRGNGGQCESPLTPEAESSQMDATIPDGGARQQALGSPISKRMSGGAPRPSRHAGGGSRIRAVAISALVAGGLGAAAYYGRGWGSGNCSSAGGRAADGSRCGGRAASARPGGR